MLGPPGGTVWADWEDSSQLLTSGDRCHFHEHALKRRCSPRLDPRPVGLGAGLPVGARAKCGWRLCHRPVPPVPWSQPAPLMPSVHEWNYSGPLPVLPEPTLQPRVQLAGWGWQVVRSTGPRSLSQNFPLSSLPQESVHLPGASGAAEGAFQEAGRGVGLQAQKPGEQQPPVP